MKYFVALAGRTFTVEVEGDAVVLEGRRLPASLSAVPATPLRHVMLGNRSAAFAMRRTAGGWQVQRAGEWWDVEVLDERTRTIRELTGQRGGGEWSGAVRAPMPGLVLRVEVQPGQRVEAGAGLVVLEAMKMENEIAAPGAGVVRSVRVEAGQVVEKGAVLAEIVGEG